MTHTFPGLACSCRGMGTFSGDTTTACSHVRFVRSFRTHPVGIVVGQPGRSSTNATVWFARLIVVFHPWFRLVSSWSVRLHRCNCTSRARFASRTCTRIVPSFVRDALRIHPGVFVFVGVSRARCFAQARRPFVHLVFVSSWLDCVVSSCCFVPSFSFVWFLFAARAS